MLWRAFLKVFKILLQWLGPAGIDTNLVTISLLPSTPLVGLTSCPENLALVLGLIASRKTVCEQAFPCPALFLLKGLPGLGAPE